LVGDALSRLGNGSVSVPLKEGCPKVAIVAMQPWRSRIGQLLLLNDEY
jgi:hypothetical protein